VPPPNPGVLFPEIDAEKTLLILLKEKPQLVPYKSENSKLSFGIIIITFNPAVASIPNAGPFVIN